MQHARRADASSAATWERLPVALLVFLFVVLAWSHANITPVAWAGSFINAPDEPAHITYVAAVAVGKRLPARDDPVYRTYQWHQPPLYYLAAAIGYPLGLSGMRAVSVLFGVVSLWAIWSAARLLLAARPLAIVLAVGLPALLPMRHAVYASVGNDAATEAVFSLLLYTVALLIHRGVRVMRVIALSVLLTAGLLTKVSSVLLIPALLVGLWWAYREERSWWKRMVRAVLPVCAGVVLASPWYVRNARVYGEIIPIKAFHAEFARTSRAADWIGKQPLAVDHWTGALRPAEPMTPTGYRALVADWTARTFYAAYTPPARQTIGAPSFLPPGAYLFFWGIVILGLAGAALSLLRSCSRHDQCFSVGLTYGLTVLLVGLSFAGFTSTYFQAQGRYLYPALLPLSVAWGAGLEGMLPARYQIHATTILLIAMAALAFMFCFGYVAPVYAGVHP